MTRRPRVTRLALLVALLGLSDGGVGGSAWRKDGVRIHGFGGKRVYLSEWHRLTPTRQPTPLDPMFLPCAPAGCDGYDQAAERAARFGTDPLLSFKASFRLTREDLVLSYAVENRGKRDAYLFTGPTWHGFLHMDYDGDPDVLFVHHERTLRTVWLNKRVPPIPTGYYPFQYYFLPVQTPLRAGGTFREEVRVPLPIQEYRSCAPQHEPRGPATVVPYEGVRFTLQYYWHTEGMTEDTWVRDGVSQTFTHGGATLTDADHGFLETEVVPLRVPVFQNP